LISIVLWLLASGVSAQEEEPLYLARVGITLALPGDWSVPRWSDWDLEARDGRKRVQLHVSSTTYQLPLVDGLAEAWAKELAIPWLTEHQKGQDFSVRQVSTVTRDGQPHTLSEIAYSVQGKTPAVAFQETFAIEGRMVHVVTTALQKNRRRARLALDTWIPGIEVEHPAVDVSDLGGSVSAGAFSAVLPDGWRKPLRGEFLEAVQLASQLGQKQVTSDTCWMGIAPKPSGETNLLLACTMELFLGVVDEHSFGAVDERIRATVFRGFGEAMGEGEVLALPADRTSALYRLPSGGDSAVWVALTPYDAGVILTYALGTPAEDAALRGAVEFSLGSMEFTGPEGGAHPEALGDTMMYFLKHRRGHPVVWSPLVLLGIAGVSLLRAQGERSSYKDLV
jgi:hypothetical protein